MCEHPTKTREAGGAELDKNTLSKDGCLTEKAVRAAETALAKGLRVELIPVKDGVKVVEIRRKEIK